MRRARIVCTIGPASHDESIIRQLIDAGMNVARLNFSHGSHDDHRRVHDTVRRVAADMGVPIAILQDLQGPKLRVGTFDGGSAKLEEGTLFRLVTEPVTGDATRAFVSYEPLPREVHVGEHILIDDGLIRLEVVGTGPTWVDTRVLVGGIVRDRKGLNVPATRLSLPSLTPKDREDLRLGVELGVDYVALSFVRSALDIHQLRAALPTGPNAPHIIAKIEKPQAVRNLQEIVAASDGIMIARGDLGVELSPEEVPIVQKRAIALAQRLGKISITATQMLESMTGNPRPTRAEASDVANAIFDGTDAVMLSAETASGAWPIESVRMMDRIVCQAENSPLRYRMIDEASSAAMQAFASAISKAAAVAAEELRVKAIVCFTVSGRTPQLMKSERPRRLVVAFTPSTRTWNRMALYWGVLPLMSEMSTDMDQLVAEVENRLRDRELARDGDPIIIVMGIPLGANAPTNMIKLHSLGHPGWGERD